MKIGDACVARRNLLMRDPIAFERDADDASVPSLLMTINDQDRE